MIQANSALTLRIALAAAALLALQACTSTPPAVSAKAPPPTPMYDVWVLVKTGPKTEGLTAPALAERASILAQVTVNYRSATGGGWHAMTLLCSEMVLCDAGLTRLRAQTTEFANVELEKRATFSPGPGRTTTR
jgi:hypothetical protein